MTAHLLTLVRPVKRALSSTTCGPSILVLMPKHSVVNRMLYPARQLIDGKEDFGSPGRIRTYSLSVNSLVPDLITIVPEPRQIEGNQQVLIKWG